MMFRSNTIFGHHVGECLWNTELSVLVTNNVQYVKKADLKSL